MGAERAERLEPIQAGIAVPARAPRRRGFGSRGEESRPGLEARSGRETRHQWRGWARGGRGTPRGTPARAARGEAGGRPAGPRDAQPGARPAPGPALSAPPPGLAVNKRAPLGRSPLSFRVKQRARTSRQDLPVPSAAAERARTPTRRPGRCDRGAARQRGVRRALPAVGSSRSRRGSRDSRTEGPNSLWGARALLGRGTWRPGCSQLQDNLESWAP